MAQQYWGLGAAAGLGLVGVVYCAKTKSTADAGHVQPRPQNTDGEEDPSAPTAPAGGAKGRRLVAHNNIEQWHQENIELFAPPICNKIMHKDDLTIMYVVRPPGTAMSGPACCPLPAPHAPRRTAGSSAARTRGKITTSTLARSSSSR